jgi:hypothetical protein
LKPSSIGDLLQPEFTGAHRRVPPRAPINRELKDRNEIVEMGKRGFLLPGIKKHSRLGSSDSHGRVIEERGKEKEDGNGSVRSEG